jgi:RNA polymerase sigma-70 factor (ECF subfamily)
MSTAVFGLDLGPGVGSWVEDGAAFASEELRRRFEARALPHLRSLYASALRMTGQPAGAEDLVQEVLLRAFRAFDGHAPGPERGVREWLHALLHQAGNEAGRRRRSKAAPESQAPGFAQGSEPTAGTGGDPVLERALCTLPEALWAAVDLRDRQDFTCEEIARIVKVPVATVIRRLHLGREWLRQALRSEAVARTRRLQEVM